MIKRFKFQIVKGILILLIPFLSFATFAQISVKAKIDSSSILIGDLVTLSLEIKHPKEIQLKGSQLVDSIKAFELHSLSELDSSFHKGKITLKQDFSFISFEPGMQFIPSFRLFYTDGDDTNIKWIATDTFQVEVLIIDADTSKAIMPIQMPLKVPLTFKDLKVIIFVYPAILLIILTILYFERKKKKKPLFAKREKPKLPAHLIAINSLRKLEDEKLWQKGDVKEFHIRLTDIIRLYIEDRYHLPAVESTTDEIMTYLQNLDIANELKSELHTFLQLSDLVKFAKLTPLPNENEKCLQSSYSFINATKEKLGSENIEKKKLD